MTNYQNLDYLFYLLCSQATKCVEKQQGSYDFSININNKISIVLKMLSSMKDDDNVMQFPNNPTKSVQVLWLNLYAWWCDLGAGAISATYPKFE